jgi:glycerol-3-phosphate acyltransferase PlsX
LPAPRSKPDMNGKYKVAVDAMTSERGVATVVNAAADALQELPDLELILVGDPSQLEPLMKAHKGLDAARCSIEPALQVIGMDEEPGSAFKAKRDASVSVACRLVKDGKAHAAVSPGNTGASVVAATLTLGRIPGVRRPGILAFMPSKSGSTAVMDVGAVVDCRPEDLVLFAIMGSACVELVLGKQEPRVGLLSIGEEDIKGNEQIFATFAMLQKAPVKFIGNVEGRDIFGSRVDVVVCDGFVGNVVLKTAEGTVRFVVHTLKEYFSKAGLLVKLGAWLAKPAFRHLAQRASDDEYGGAFLLGVAADFIIAHGSSNQLALKNAIRQARRCAEYGLTAKLAARISQVSSEVTA